MEDISRNYRSRRHLHQEESRATSSHQVGQAVPYSGSPGSGDWRQNPDLFTNPLHLGTRLHTPRKGNLFLKKVYKGTYRFAEVWGERPERRINEGQSICQSGNGEGEKS